MGRFSTDVTAATAWTKFIEAGGESGSAGRPLILVRDTAQLVE
jgi:hypothetical protein